MFERVFSFLSQLYQTLLSDPLRRFQAALTVLVFLTVFAIIGYILIEDMTFIDAMYMTIITLSTVGFDEVQELSGLGRAFTSVLIILGIGVATTALSNAIGILTVEHWPLRLRKRTLERERMQLRNHYIVCGYGRTGRQICADLRARDEPFVVVDSRPDLEEEFVKDGYHYVIGDATHDDTLDQAGVKHARGFVAALSNDPANVLTVLTARERNARLFIIARVTRLNTESKLLSAGADRVINPYQIGGHRMALTLLRPMVHDFLDQIFHFGEDRNIDIGQITVHEASDLVGQAIGSCDLHRVHKLNILGIRRPSGELVLTPDLGHPISLGDVLIVIGPVHTIYQLERQNLAKLE